VVKTNIVIVSPLQEEKKSFDLIVKRENIYKQTKMPEIKLYIYKVICVLENYKGCLCYLRKSQEKSM